MPRKESSVPPTTSPAPPRMYSGPPEISFWIPGPPFRETSSAGIFPRFSFFFTKTLANYEKVFFEFSVELVNGKLIDLKEYKNKKAILLVNTASYCGFTKQYNDMQNIWEKYQNKGLLVLAVPSNSFNQEKKTEKESISYKNTENKKTALKRHKS